MYKNRITTLQILYALPTTYHVESLTIAFHLVALVLLSCVWLSVWL